jgi:hypothetical protein
MHGTITGVFKNQVRKMGREQQKRKDEVTISLFSLPIILTLHTYPIHPIFSYRLFS